MIWCRINLPLAGRLHAQAEDQVCLMNARLLLTALWNRLSPVRLSSDNLFKLPEVTKKIDQAGLVNLMSPGAQVSELLYDPEKLESNFAPWRHRVEQVSFSKVSFFETVIERFEFDGCTFNRCLFIGTIFRDCRFRKSRFLDCNFYRCEFIECFADPKQFDGCLPRKGYANVGVHLFQELLRNSRQQVQPDFADEAQFRFRKWQRYQLWAEMVNSGSLPTFLKGWPVHFAKLLFSGLTGSGMRLGRLLLSAAGTLLLVSGMNLWFAEEFGLKPAGSGIIQSFGDAFYVTVVIMTTLGFGDITPTETLGRLVVSFEALLGFAGFAFLTSTLYRRLSS